MFKNDEVRKALQFSMENHEGQVYADVHPYVVHLFDVMMVLVEFGVDTPNILTAALLHDIIEDTACNYHDVKEHFGMSVAEIVYAVTDELGKNRRERKKKTMPKLNGFTEAQLVKVADWISNVRQCHRNSHKMYGMYKKDYQEFSKFKEQVSAGGLYEENLNHMWEELSSLLEMDVREFKNGHDTHHPEFDHS
jgi:(p)ppGpp synthase/HD superfamily hydrolase